MSATSGTSERDGTPHRETTALAGPATASVLGKLAVREIAAPAAAATLFNALARDPHPFFLDSGQLMKGFGRWSFIGSRPFLVLTVKGREARERTASGERVRRGNAFAALKSALRRYHVEGGTPVPFATGAVGFLAYDLCHHVEHLPDTMTDDIGFPDLYFAFYDRAAAFDHRAGRCFLLANDFGDAPGTPDERLDELESRLRPLSLPPPRITAGSVTSNFSRPDYLRAIGRAKEYIAAGDIFQVCLSQRFHAEIDDPPYDLYRRLREINPAPFAAYLDLGGGRAVVSASPERFLDLRGRRVQTRPIKGTRPRGATPAEDERLGRELLDAEKDGAELAMIVDLERNDIGRVCEYGTVRVTEPKVLESFPTVHHLVATVEGRLHERHDVVDLLKATFPGGSISGAPKVRAMEIIDELEPTRRSVYTGALGYIGFDGCMDLNIVIRTFICRGRDAFFQMGGGIVADSTLEGEYEETLDKAKAFMQAVGNTE